MAGSEPIVTELPTVTEEMLMGTVPLIDAVTEPIWDVPAPIVTVPAIVCVPVGLAVTVPAMVTVLPIVTDAIETGWVAGKLEMETTLPLTAPLISVMA